MPMSRCLLVLLIVALVWTPFVTPSGGCPFCNAEGQTLTKEINLAPLVIYGTIHKSKVSRLQRVPDASSANADRSRVEVQIRRLLGCVRRLDRPFSTDSRRAV